MRDARNIREVSQLGVDMIGMIFYPKSPRYVEMQSSHAGIIPDYAKEDIGASDTSGNSSKDTSGNSSEDTSENSSEDSSGNSSKSVSVSSKTPARVGVFVDDMVQNIVTRVVNYHLDYVQLHGNEPRTMCENLRSTLDPDIRPGIKIIKAISVSDASDIQKYKEYVGAVDLFLFDTKCKTVGGSGQQFDWQVLEQYDGEVPFLLSGGIGPDDASRLHAFHHPKCIGIDLNSRFEVEPGVKDVEKLKEFLLKVKR